MNLGDYRTLFQGWLNRSDCPNSLADTFMARAIARIQREVRIPAMEASYTPALGADGTWATVGLPDDYIAMKDVVGDNILVYPVTLDRLLLQPLQPGRPQFYTRVMGTLQFRPWPTQSLTIYYYGQFGSLVADTDTNALLSAAPEVLLWAQLAYAGDFFKMDEKAQWEAQYEGERDALVQQGLDADFFNSPQGVQPIEGVEFYL
jgi:hypothetical protein